MRKVRWLLWSLLALMPLGCQGSNASDANTCRYNPELGQPNPLGFRAYISLVEEEGNTRVIFEQLPSNLADKITIASQRELTFYGTPIETARIILLQNPEYYNELVGYEAPEGFAPVNEVLSC
jgi:hypothetical protein